MPQVTLQGDHAALRNSIQILILKSCCRNDIRGARYYHSDQLQLGAAVAAAHDPPSHGASSIAEPQNLIENTFFRELDMLNTTNRSHT